MSTCSYVCTTNEEWKSGSFGLLVACDWRQDLRKIWQPRKRVRTLRPQISDSVMLTLCKECLTSCDPEYCIIVSLIVVLVLIRLDVRSIISDTRFDTQIFTIWIESGISLNRIKSQIVGVQIKSLYGQIKSRELLNRDVNQIAVWICPSLPCMATELQWNKQG